MSYQGPNYTQVPNEFFDDQLAEIESVAELKVTLQVMRQTVGFHRESKWLTVSRLMELTGLSKPSVIDGIKRALARGTVLRREKDGKNHFSLAVKTLNPDKEDGGKESLPEPVKKVNPRKETPRKESSSLEANASKSGEAQAPSPEPEVAPQGKEKAQSPGAFGVKELVDRVEAARKRGAPIHDPPELGNYGRFFSNRLKRHEVETLLFALDYLVARASGEVEGERKAWCGFDTALDAVLAGWRPKSHKRDVPPEELRPHDDEYKAMVEGWLGETA